MTITIKPVPKRRNVMRILSSIVIVTFAAVLFVSPAGAGMLLKGGHVSAADNGYQLGAELWGKRVAEITKGEVKINSLCCAQLGNDVAQAKAVHLGAQDFAIVSSNNLSQFDPRIDIFSLPGLFQDNASAQRAVRSPVGAEIFENFRKATGLRVVYTTGWGARAIINNIRPIYKLEDIKGLLIRSPGSPVMNSTYKLVGANPVPVAFAELFTALQQKTVDGADMSPCDILTLKYYEVQKYLTTTNLFVGFGCIVMNDKKFSKYSPAIQKALLDAGKEAEEYSWSIVDKCDKRGIAKAKEVGLTVVELTEAERMPIFKQVRAVWPEYANKVGGQDLINRLAAASM